MTPFVTIDLVNFAALARSDDTSMIKLIFFGIAALIWIISTIAKATAKQSKQPPPPPTDGNWMGEDGSLQSSPTEASVPPAVPNVAQWAPPPAYTPQPPPMPMRSEPAYRGNQPAVTFPAEWLGQSPAATRPPPIPQSVAPVFVPQYVPEDAAPVIVQASPPVDSSAWVKGDTGYETTRSAGAAPARAKQHKQNKQNKQSKQTRQTQQRAGKAASTTRPLDAAAIRQWMTPQVMSRQFVLTELFDPPPSARKERP